MKALYPMSSGDYELMERPKPTAVGDRALVRVARAAICHTDIISRTRLAEQAGAPSPAIPGHEFAGVVEAAGPAAKHVQPGDRVAIHQVLNCGQWPGQGQAAHHPHSAFGAMEGRVRPGD
jgi:threonine dehydrogenase-like Zn-dependent dehydrogenase